MSVAADLQKMTPEQLAAHLNQRAEEKALRDERAKRHAKRVVDAEEQPAHPPLKALTLDELFARPVPRYVIDQILPDVGLVQVVGEPGSLKTFFTAAMGLTIASGQKDFFGYPVLKHGAVLYIAAEGAGAFQFRIRAWCHEHGVDPLTIPFHIVPMAVNLRAPDFQEQLLAVIRELQPVLIVIDTLARCTPGAEENSAKDMTEVIAFCSEMQGASTCAVVFVHHPTKSDPRGGGRGSGAVFGAVDTEIRISKEDVDEGAEQLPITVTCAKQKDDGRFPDLELVGWVVPVHDEFGRDMAHQSGRGITSIVLRPVDEAAVAEQRAAAARAEDTKKRTQEQEFDVRVLEAMKEHPELTSQHKLREFLGVALKDVKDAVARILQAGLAESGERNQPFKVTSAGERALARPF